MAFVNLYQARSRDARLQIGNEELLFTMPFGNAWTRLRLGFRFTVLSAQPTMLLSNAKILFGVVSGSSGYSVATCAGWMGMSFSNGGMTWNTVANNPGYWTATNTYVQFGWKVGVQTNFVNNASVGPYCVATRYPVHGAWLLDITRPSYLNTANYLVQPRTVAIASESVDLTYPRFIEACRNFTTPGAYFITSAVNQLTGYFGTAVLDTVSIYWNRSVPVLEISDVVALRIT